MIGTVDEDLLIAPIEEKLRVEELAIFIMNFDSDGIEKYDKMVRSLIGSGSYSYAPKELDIDFKNIVIPPAQPSIKEPTVWN